MVDWTKPIQTKDGRMAHLIREIHNPRYPMVVLIHQPWGEEQVTCYCISGQLMSSKVSNVDIINRDEATDNG